MRRIDTTNRSPNLFGSGKDGFRNGDMGLGVSPTEFNAEWCNALQEELASVIEATGVALNGANNVQVLNAIQNLIEARVGDFSLATGGANVKTVALNPAITSYTENFSGVFKNNALNTGAVTVNFGGGAVSLRADTGDLLVAGDLPANAIVGYQYINGDKAYVTSTVSSQALSLAAAEARYSIQQGAPVATTSGTNVPLAITIPPGVKRICIAINGMSTNGVSPPVLQLGDAGGYETTGYVGSSGTNQASNSVFSTMNGFALSGSWNGISYSNGLITLTRIIGNEWNFAFTATGEEYGPGPVYFYGNGSKALSAELDRVRLNTVSGVDAFDAGQAIVSWEF